VPHLNGETYSHKPPLFFWLMTASWWLFGVNDWSLRLIAPLFSLATLYLSALLARNLWPERRKIEDLSALILLGLFFWNAYSTLTMFDMMLAFFVILGIYSLQRLAFSGLSFQRWLLLGVAIGGGVFSKGPVILLHLLPVAVLAPWWLKQRPVVFHWKQWYLGLGLAVLIGSIIALSWAIPAGIAGGEAYRNAIFLDQTSGRLVKSFAHQLPWWWYLETLPLLLLPWLLFRPLWSGLRQLNLQDSGLRFCLAWALPVFIAFSLVSGKRLHYLLPLVPALALVLARAIDDISDLKLINRGHVVIVSVLGFLGAVLALLPWLNLTFNWRPELSLISPVWGGLLLIVSVALAFAKSCDAREAVLYVCIASITAVLIVECGFFSIKADHYDTSIAANKIGSLMKENRDIAFYGSKYHGQYHFTGRLEHPITVIADGNGLRSWAENHQNGYIIVNYTESAKALEPMLAYHYPNKGQNVGLLSAKALLENPALESMMKL
jgi:4-amino-4-deoxy-L-arabinose transferase-like glycosyltransferase